MQTGERKKRTLSMLAALSLMIDACAKRSKTERRAFFEYNSCGVNSSSRNALLNIVCVMSCSTEINKIGIEQEKVVQRDLKL